MHASGSRHELRGADLRSLERMQLRQCLRADGNADEDEDELRVQLRQRAVRGVHEHRDAGVHTQHQRQQLWRHYLWKLGRLRRLQRHVR